MSLFRWSFFLAAMVLQVVAKSREESKAEGDSSDEARKNSV